MPSLSLFLQAVSSHASGCVWTKERSWKLVRMPNKCLWCTHWSCLCVCVYVLGSTGLTPVASHCREEVSARPAFLSPSSVHLLVPAVVLSGVGARRSGRIRVWGDHNMLLYSVTKVSLSSCWKDLRMTPAWYSVYFGDCAGDVLLEWQISIVIHSDSDIFLFLNRPTNYSA